MELVYVSDLWRSLNFQRMQHDGSAVEAAGQPADYADRARIVGLTCERVYGTWESASRII